jgi:class 3 adenylate cyclase
MDNIVRELFEKTASQTGQEFFDALVKNMSLIFGTKGAWVTEYIEKEFRLKSKSFWYGGNYVKDYNFHIVGTPCETVFTGRQLVHIPENLVELYPDGNDTYTQDSVSYLGVAIFDDDQSIMGHLALMDNKPFYPEQELINIFKLFAERAAGEFKRLKAEKHLHNQMQTLLADARISSPLENQRSERNSWEEDLIVMFLDLNSSTSIAEKLGNDLFFDLVRDFIDDLTMPILKNLGIIYKYVGDEVIVLWKLNEGISNANCLKCFFEIDKLIQSRQEIYQSKFGVFPEYKAGMHCGKVTVGTIGSIVKEKVYSGDVLNTTSRITNMCRNLGARLLLSEELASQLTTFGQFTHRKFENVNLRGKLKEATLFEFLPAG